MTTVGSNGNMKRAHIKLIIAKCCYLCWAQLSFADVFFTVGHVYDLDIDKTEVLVKAIKKVKQSGDPLFVLGDSNLQFEKYRTLWLDNFGNDVTFVPGNHELDAGLAQYQKWFSSPTPVKGTKKYILLPLVSMAPVEEIRAQISHWLHQYRDDDRKKIIVTHHRIWDDGVVSSRPFSHDKSFLYSEIADLITNNIDAIIAGNSKRQHFQDLPEALNGNVPDIYTLFWMGRVAGTQIYNIGNGGSKPYAGFVEFRETPGKELFAIGHTVKTSNDQLTDLGTLDSSLFNITWRDKDNMKDKFFTTLVQWIQSAFMR